MPLPTPRKSEKRKEFIPRCTGEVFDEGTLQGRKLDPKKEDDRAQVVAVCNTQWRKVKNVSELDEAVSLGLQAIETALLYVRGESLLSRIAEDSSHTEEEVIEKVLKDLHLELTELTGVDEANSFNEAEKVMKTVGGKKYPSTDFLVVEDPKKPSKWHLQVSRNGVPDHNLMAAARGALTNPNYRGGNPYKGPNKREALKDLKALYKSEDMEWEEMEEEEMDDELWEALHVIMERGIEGDLRSLANNVESAFDAAFAPETRWREEEPRRYMVRSVLMAHPGLGDAVIVEDRTEGLLYSCGYTKGPDGYEFVDRESWKEVELTYKVVGEESDDEPPEEETPEEKIPQPAEEAYVGELEEMEFSELVAEIGQSDPVIGHAIEIRETGDVATGGSRPLIMDVVPIAPGWGNRKDNNFYPRAVLERDSPRVFTKVKMHETNHIDAETNNRNWVSTIIKTDRFTPSGEPISEVGVHDPGFAQKVLNLSELNLLDMLQCSIRGSGKVRIGTFEKDGRSGKYVESIDELKTVDWVSKAGAGGRALNISEENGGKMNEQKKPDKKVPPEEEEEEEEEEEGKKPSKSCESAEGQPTSPASAPLSEEVVEQALEEIALPQSVKQVLLKSSFADQAELDETVQTMVEEFKERTKSGKPIAGRSPAPASPSKRELREKAESSQTTVNKRWLGTRARNSKE